MSSALTLVVLGQAYFFGSLPVTPEQPLSPAIIYQKKIEPEPVQWVRPNDYTFTPGIGGHKVHIQAATWNEARKTCEAEGGHLAIINSVAESRALAKLFGESAPHVGTQDPDSVHIGFHDLYAENEWVTIHGESLDTAGFNEWAWGQPSYYQNDERCGSIFRDGKLNDISCKKIVGFICELPYIPAAPTPSIPYSTSSEQEILRLDPGTNLTHEMTPSTTTSIPTSTAAAEEPTTASKIESDYDEWMFQSFDDDRNIYLP